MQSARSGWPSCGSILGLGFHLHGHDCRLLAAVGGKRGIWRQIVLPPCRCRRADFVLEALVAPEQVLLVCLDVVKPLWDGQRCLGCLLLLLRCLGSRCFTCNHLACLSSDNGVLRQTTITIATRWHRCAHIRSHHRVLG
ncbi:hypothetical protein CAOG_010138 [Capsaspora owczarzaki ATCC 30864]|uniref:Uncharacterized protein n=1 Tax=Capsaspora owczarzaki (strain ATCC 30864) TaxID=595528 RepID=A0A0D2W063_CAPO3|nr:hypothetical protein CAOG_010138 [Capsaspora owczarzaki ATCC 30864]